MIIDALKSKYSLPDLLEKLNLAKSSYYYQEKILYVEDKYFHLRIRIIQLFHENRDHEARETNGQTKTQTEI